MHLPGKITYKEIDEMIKTVDKNEDWKISYSEFRVRNSIFLIWDNLPIHFDEFVFLPSTQKLKWTHSRQIIEVDALLIPFLCF